MGLLDFFRGTKAQLIFGRLIDTDVTIPLTEHEIIIGREKGTSGIPRTVWKEGTRIKIIDTTITRSVSRDHVKLTWDERLKGYTIEDLGSKLGTLVKSKPLPAGTQVLLQNKDKVILGQGIMFQIIY